MHMYVFGVLCWGHICCYFFSTCSIMLNTTAFHTGSHGKPCEATGSHGKPHLNLHKKQNEKTQ